MSHKNHSNAETQEEKLDSKESQNIEINNISSEEENPLKKDSDKNNNTKDRIEELEKIIKEKDKEISSHNDKILRLHAEFENFRKRSLREKTEFCQYAYEKLMSQLLPVLDNFDSAFLSIPSHENKNSIKSFIEGINMSYKSLLCVLEKEGLKEINSTGKDFDPVIHDAVQMVECQDHPDQCVIEQLQKGYYLGDKILRHPKVKVSRNISNKEKNDDKQKTD
ncbi:MAG: nucleotide exchange factor GrpE [Candidatus Firestonebacteria bacterium]|nr:nucleotide exchange factor GrpE [Candidatus Firestonebacteria bacterium]